MLLVAALLVVDSSRGQRAEAFCDGVGQPMDATSSWGRLRANTNTCDLDNIYAATVYDRKKDGSCAYFGYDDPNPVYYHAYDCTHNPQSSGKSFLYFDNDSYSIVYVWRWKNGVRQYSDIWQNFGY
ncbi:hypothetical protein BMS3Bbin02_02051 [bacterium BMS3Bbin02]|nr:hypothetical protein BMS3Bbin02_02051 [bacterium BMS3Bbin02]